MENPEYQYSSNKIRNREIKRVNLRLERGHRVFRDLSLKDIKEIKRMKLIPMTNRDIGRCFNISHTIVNKALAS